MTGFKVEVNPGGEMCDFMKSEGITPTSKKWGGQLMKKLQVAVKQKNIHKHTEVTDVQIYS